MNLSLKRGENDQVKKKGRAKALACIDFPCPKGFRPNNSDNSHFLNVYYFVGLAQGASFTSFKTLTTIVVIVVISIPNFYKKKLKVGIGETKLSFEKGGTPEWQQKDKIMLLESC